MFELKRWEPLKELSTIQRDMDDLFRRTFGNLTANIFGREVRMGLWSPAVDCFVKEGNFVVHADIPGIDPRNIDISITGNLLTIKGERKSEVEEKKGGYLFREASYGTFERTVSLPEGCETDKVHATYRNGVLELTMPAKAGALPRKVKIEVEELKKAA